MKFVQKEYHLCNTDENGWENYKQKICHRSPTWKQQEVQLLHWMNFTRKTFKTIASMKKWSTRKSCVFIAAFHRYITCLIPVSQWRATSKKSTWKTEWSSGRTATEVQVLHAMHFRRIYFAIKVERVISPFTKLLENGRDSEKTIKMKTFCIFRSFSTVYYLPRSDEVCRNYGENTFLAIFKINIKP